MKILVTGATGLVGRHLVRRLLDTGHEVVALSRNVGDAEVSLPVRCLVHEWRPGAGQMDASALDSVEGVVHLAGESVGEGRFDLAHKDAIAKSRIEGTRALVTAIAARPATDRPRVLVAASATGFYGERGDEELDETSTAGSGFLADVCRAWESESRRVETAGLRWVALRTGLVLARDGGALERLLPIFRLGLGGSLGGGKQWMNWIHVEDLVSLYIAALENPAWEGPVNAVAPQPIRNREFSKALGRALGRPAVLPAPAFALRAVLGQKANLLLESQRVFSQAAADTDFPFDYPDLASALSELCADLSKVFEMEMWLDRRPEEVFPFFADARNLETITPSFLGFRILQAPPDSVHEGALLEYRIRLHGVPLRWRTRIDVWDPPRTFVDTQLKGPYKSWRHTHDFEPLDGGTLVRDIVRYELPFGALGDIVAGRFVERDVALIFAYRRTRLLELFA